MLGEKVRLSCARRPPTPPSSPETDHIIYRRLQPLAAADDDSPDDYRFGVGGNPVGAKSGTHTILYTWHEIIIYPYIYFFFFPTIVIPGSDPPSCRRRCNTLCTIIITFAICRFDWILFLQPRNNRFKF